MQINELISSLKTPTKLQKTIPYKLPKQKTEISKVNSPLGQGKVISTQIKIACWNINGLRAVLKKNYLQSYLIECEPDILCLNEIKIDQQAFIDSSISQQIPSIYYSYWNFCKPPLKGYSGVSILTKIQPISIKEDIDIEIHSHEGRILQAEFDQFYLIVVYVPNSGFGLKRLQYRVKQFDKDFQRYVNKLKQHKNVMICGDLNVAHQPIDIMDPESNQKSPGYTQEERNSFNNMLNSGWIDTFRHLYPNKIQYSWWCDKSYARQQNIGRRIDYILVSLGLEQYIHDAIINECIYGSDHCPIEIIVNIGLMNKKNGIMVSFNEEYANKENLDIQNLN